MSRTAQHPIRTQNRHRRLATVAPVVAGLGLALLLSGCGAGQITQTDTQVAAVNGASGNAGPIAVRGAELAYPGGQGVYQPGSNAELIVTIVNTGVTDDTLTGISSPAAVGATIDGSASGSKDLPGGFAIIGGRDVDGQDTTATAIPLTTEQPTGSTTAPSGLPGGASTTTGTSGTSGVNASGLPGTSGATTTEPSTTAGSTVGQLPGTAKPGTVKIMLTGIKTVNGAPLRAGLTIPITFVFAKAGQVTINVPIAAPADNSPAVANTGS